VPIATDRLALVVRLVRIAELPDLVARGESPSLAVRRSPNAWALGQRAIRAVPALVEADPLRALAQLPAVNFSSILSARPLVRGYEPNLTAVRVDGFEMRNLYRLGRFLSSFPADAVGQVRLETPGTRPTATGMAGTIDITGRREQAAGGGLSLGSLGGYFGRRGSKVGGFAATRFLHLTAARVVGVRAPITFFDQYGRLDLGSGQGHTRLSALLTYDGYGQADDGALEAGRWYSGLLGGRTALYHRDSSTVSVDAAWVRFDQRVERGPTKRVPIDVATRTDHLRLGVSGQHRGSNAAAAWGVGLARRAVETRIVSVADQSDGVGPQPVFELQPYQLDFARPEVDGYLSLDAGRAGGNVEVGFHVQGGGGVLVASPWVTAERSLGADASITVSATRARALHQFVSDPASEPDLSYFDYWVPAGAARLPATIDHLVVSGSWAVGPWVLRATGYGSYGCDLIEVRPASDQLVSGSADFRTGRSRTIGLEFQVVLAGGEGSPNVGMLSYALSKSERRWSQGWVPWSLDRRLQVRFLGMSRFARRWRADLLIDVASGVPFTPIVGGITPGRLPALPSAGNPALFGRENGGRDVATLRADVGLTHYFNGPWGSQVHWGISVINATWASTLPLKLSGDLGGSPPGYERIGALPGIPTLTLRATF
jgi:hypothetical protein